MKSLLKAMLTDFGQALTLSSKTHTIPVPQTHGPALMLFNSINSVHPNHRPAKAFHLRIKVEASDPNL